MDIDKEFRQAVQDISQPVAQDVRFTPELAQKIRDRAGEGRRSGYRKLYTAATAVACLAAALAVWNPDMSELQNQVKQSAAALSDQKSKAIMQAALQPLQKAIPELSGYKLEMTGSTAGMITAFLREKDGVYANIAVNKQTGKLEVFKWSTGNGAQKQPSAQVAKEKAEQFLQAMLGEISAQYQQVAAGEIARPRSGYLDLDVPAIAVTYKKMKNGKTVPFSDVVVWVDGAGKVVSYGQVSDAEQATFTRLREALPELNPDAVLSNKGVHSSGYSFLLMNADKEGNQALISMTGQGDALTDYAVESVGNRQEPVEWAPKTVAVGKADQFLQSMLGEERKQYRETGNYDNPTYMRYYNDIPVLEDSLYVAVDKSGRIRQYTRSDVVYDPVALPDPSSAVPRQSAEGVLAKNMKLRYIEQVVIKRDPQAGGKPEVRPMLDYTPAVADLQMGISRSLYWYIDAVTGKIQYGAGNNGIDYDRRGTNEPITLNAGKNNQPVMVKTKEEAASLLAKDMGVDVKGLKSGEGKDDDSPSGKKKHFFWETKEGRQIDVTIDAQTGRVVDITIPRVDHNITVSEQVAFKEAIGFLEKFVDRGVTEVQLSQVIEPGEPNPVSSGSWEFEFIKSHEGVPVLEQYPGEAYIISVDPSTGKVHGFVNRTHMQEAVALPDKSKAVPVEQAVREYLAYMPLQLAYTVKGAMGERLASPKLVYVPMSDSKYADRNITIDAITGKAVIH
ncbi:peptidase [Brevibacillus fluminis]|uniref:Peptidase n=1 Tax=Brevibacillus fluminis TaxID=511487 RepID=A0A3M8CUL6_9BACL|nr:YcdB/YcdC domain-containing protein [Brevibacillus fluminis]RNB79496.1 peptidase [Brevibacillus fluminis]